MQSALKALDGLRRAYEDMREYAAPLKLEQTEVSLPEVWREAFADLASRLAEREVHLVEAFEGVNVRCEADGPRLQQVFRNLFENALDACPDPVEIRIVCEETRWNEAPALRIAVIDNGPGVDAAQAGQVLDAFFTTKPKGTGLGLAIVKRIVEAHGGGVEAGSAPGGGFRVRIVLPRLASNPG